MDKALTENVPGRQVRLQPADRDAGQRAGRRRQERRGRPALRRRPRRPRGRRRPRSSGCCRGSPAPQDVKTPTARPAADAPHLGPPRPARPLRDQGGRRPRRRRRPGRHDRRQGLRGPDRRPPSRSACPQSWRNDPEPIGSIRIADPQGRPIPLERPGRHHARGRARARSSARTSSAGLWSASTSGAATSPASSPRPRPRSTPRSRCPPATSLRWGGQFEHLQTGHAAADDRRAGRAGC